MASRGFGCSPAALLATASYNEVLVSFGEVILLPENDNHCQFTGTVARATSLSHQRYEFLGLQRSCEGESRRGIGKLALPYGKGFSIAKEREDPQYLCAAQLVGLSAI